MRGEEGYGCIGILITFPSQNVERLRVVECGDVDTEAEETHGIL